MSQASWIGYRQLEGNSVTSCMERLKEMSGELCHKLIGKATGNQLERLQTTSVEKCHKLIRLAEGHERGIVSQAKSKGSRK
jgi:hypothetical protein